MAANSSLGNDPPLAPAEVWHGGLFDHKLLLGKLDLKGGVIEVAGRASREPSGQRLIDSAVQPDEMPTSTKR
jgi:hypothetical protein